MSLRGTHAPKQPITAGTYSATFGGYEDRTDSNNKEFITMHFNLEDGRTVTMNLYSKEDSIVYSQSYNGVIDGMFRQFFPDMVTADNDELVWQHLESDNPFDIYVKRTWSKKNNRFYTNYFFTPQEAAPEDTATDSSLPSTDDGDDDIDGMLS